jgi:hypothetical protein
MKTRQVLCVADADFTLPPLSGAHPDQRIEQARAAALAELDAWAEKALTVAPLFTDNHIQQVDGIPNDVRANYVAYLRISMAIQQLETVGVLDCVKHPKRNDLIAALRVWANKAMKAADPNSPQPFRTE